MGARGRYSRKPYKAMTHDDLIKVMRLAHESAIKIADAILHRGTDLEVYQSYLEEAASRLRGALSRVEDEIEFGPVGGPEI